MAAELRPGGYHDASKGPSWLGLAPGLGLGSGLRFEQLALAEVLAAVVEVVVEAALEEETESAVVLVIVGDGDGGGDVWLETGLVRHGLRC